VETVRKKKYADAMGMSDILLIVETGRNWKKYADSSSLSNTLLRVETGRN
jgi:hypothetical protein